ncbi:ABC transporter ATP-binding protein [Palleronia sp. LCG004]|uniref:ABC transporter ATP-binding protein n=1 Tax=Palleronia sp. LCG004 TaxID=3079304 RepID=UPI002942A0BD|nr:ABC transporter ATP-binding protein [Palleronia sp. LCG004]WOI57697.1 ABC transporter ATP-binding protein [Palleronia sp. LCG004]
MSGQGSLVDIRNLNIRFRGARNVHAINDLTLELEQGETLALLGESGSGKSVTLKALLRLLPPRRTDIDGVMKVNAVDVMSLKGRALQDYRGGEVSMVFQEPGLALDPVYTIGHQIAEAVRRKTGVSRDEAMSTALDMLRRVRIPSPDRRLRNYPHELSGGMLQRVMIALALSCRPRLLLADEPTTALDATVQIQILLLLRALQREFGMGVIFVTHDIGVAVEVSERIAVMYAGQIVEEGTTREIIKSPRHPYTKGLLAANLHDVARGTRLDAIPGAPPPLDTKPDACPFAPRCPLAEARCRAALPPVHRIGPRRRVACIHADAPMEVA